MNIFATNYIQFINFQQHYYLNIRISYSLSPLILYKSLKMFPSVLNIKNIMLYHIYKDFILLYYSITTYYTALDNTMLEYYIE